ncbi:hypothetical protein BHM03_00051422 [Ensete ventricosum]|nr:hypothetical protein BHM03_00051422 [Ensete ventricosum]
MIPPVPGGTYWSISRPVCGPCATGRYYRLGLFLPHFYPHRCPGWFQSGCGEKEGEEEGEPRTAPPSNGEATARLLLRHVLRRRPETFAAGKPRDGAVDEENLKRQRLLCRGLLVFFLGDEEKRRPWRCCRRFLLIRAGRRKRGDVKVTRKRGGLGDVLEKLEGSLRVVDQVKN